MKVKLAYGREGLTVNIPDHLETDVIEPLYISGLPEPMEAVSGALRAPIGHIPLRASLSSGQKVAIIFSDITRATPYDILLPCLLKELDHLPDENITFFCACGTHRKATHQELCTILGKQVVERFRIVQNDSSDDGSCTGVGTTSAGNRILLNSELMAADLRILTGFIEPHFFAGFSGGGKALMPGMAHEGTIRFNHAIRFLEHPDVRWGITDGNPLWEDITEAAGFASPLFLLNVTLNKEKEITGVFAGDLLKAHRAGCEFARKSAMAALDSPYDIVITTNSGYPLDLNVYQSVKGMSAAAQVVKKDGHIIVAAECWDGIPSNSDYEKILTSVGNVSELMDYIKSKESSLKDTWQIYFQAKIQMHATVHLFSRLEDTEVEKTHLRPVKDIGLFLSRWGKHHPDPPRICVLPEGPQTIPYLQ